MQLDTQCLYNERQGALHIIINQNWFVVSAFRLNHKPIYGRSFVYIAMQCLLWCYSVRHTRSARPQDSCITTCINRQHRTDFHLISTRLPVGRWNCDVSRLQQPTAACPARGLLLAHTGFNRCSSSLIFSWSYWKLSNQN